MKVYEYVSRCYAGGTNFYRVEVGSCTNLLKSGKGCNICIDTWAMPMSPSEYITTNSNPIISSKIIKFNSNSSVSYQSTQKSETTTPSLLDIILVKIVDTCE